MRFGFSGARRRGSKRSWLAWGLGGVAVLGLGALALVLWQVKVDQEVAAEIKRRHPYVLFNGQPAWIETVSRWSGLRMGLITYVDLSNCHQVTDDDLARISRLKYLQVLTLHCYRPANPDPAGLGSQVTDAGLEHLARLKYLRALDVTGPALTDQGLVHLARLPRLEYLSVDECPRITDAGVGALKELDRLKGLTMKRAGVTSLSAGLPRFLEHLDLTYSRLNSQGLQVVARHGSRLHTLYLGGTDIDAPSTRHLAALPVERLSLGMTRITDASVAHLASMPRLSSVYLGNTGVTDRCVVHLARLPELQVLVIHETQITGRGCAPLYQSAGLRMLASPEMVELDVLQRNFAGYVQVD